MAGAISQLPPHERRRLLAVGGDDIEDLARRRLAGEPLQYLEGTAQFTDFEVAVDRRVLIPRPETEGLYELVAHQAPPRVIVDVGTGSGVLAIALARRYGNAEVHAVDVSAGALEVARSNASRLGVELTFHHGDLFFALPQKLRRKVDLLVANPPYVAEGEWELLPPDVRREPRVALVAGPKGTEALERIAVEASAWLAPGGIVACEIGESQGLVVEQLFAPIGEVAIHPDLAGRHRYLLARKKDGMGR